MTLAATAGGVPRLPLYLAWVDQSGDREYLMNVITGSGEIWKETAKSIIHNENRIHGAGGLPKASERMLLVVSKPIRIVLPMVEDTPTFQ